MKFSSVLAALCLVASASLASQSASAGFSPFSFLGPKAFTAGQVGYMCEIGSPRMSDAAFGAALRAEYKQAKAQVVSGEGKGLFIMLHQEIDSGSDTPKGEMMLPFHSDEVQCAHHYNGGAVIQGGTSGLGVADAGDGGHVCCLSIIKD
jgi:hypothetical protein